jgi:pyruvate dehydrogenase E1 component alpha subunit
LQDPIETTLQKLKDIYKISEQDIEAINERVKSQIEESVQFAEESPWPDDSEVYKDVYVQQDYPFIKD